MLLVPVDELGLSIAIMPLENWGLQITDRFYSFYSEAISNSLIMLPETLGLFLLGLYAGKKDIFRRAKELDPKLKKMANHYVHFNITDVVYYGLLLYEQSTIHTIFTYGHYDDKRKDIVHLLHCHVNAFITKRKMANSITSIPIRWTNGVNELHLTYNCYITCIRATIQK